MTYKILDVEGIGPEFARKLEDVQIRTTDDLIKHCADPMRRRQVVEKTGVSDTLLVKWLRMADLMRLKGVGPQYAELLMMGEVDSIAKLRGQDPTRLEKKLEQLNATRKLAGTTPKSVEIERWMEDARTVEPLTIG